LGSRASHISVGVKGRLVAGVGPFSALYFLPPRWMEPWWVGFDAPGAIRGCLFFCAAPSFLPYGPSMHGKMGYVRGFNSLPLVLNSATVGILFSKASAPARFIWRDHAIFSVVPCSNHE